MRRLIALSSLACLMGMAGTAGASVSYSYITDTPTAQSAPNQPVTVGVYLLESLTGTSASLLNSEGGLFGAGIELKRVAGNATVMNVTSPTFTGPTSLDNNDPTDYAFSVGRGTTQSGVAGDNSTAAGNGTSTAVLNKVLLATATIMPGTGPSTFSVGQDTANTGNTLTNTNFYDLDTTSTSPAYTGVGDTVTSLAIPANAPEPASLSLLGLSALGLLARRRKA